VAEDQLTLMAILNSLQNGAERYLYTKKKEAAED
jgi:hypothetical protein